MLPTNFIYGILLLFFVLSFSYTLDVQGYDQNATKKWWTDSVSALEPFQNQLEAFEGGAPLIDLSKQDSSSVLMEYAPGKPAPTELYNKKPFHLLSDILEPVLEEGDMAPSCVTSRSCFATDTEAHLSKVGNYRQMTNNYKREYPDNCSAPRQDLVLNFYKAEPVHVSR